MIVHIATIRRRSPKFKRKENKHRVAMVLVIK